MFETEDEDLDFAPAAGSKLASVFGLDRAKENGNPSLVYTPPKQPKPMEYSGESQVPTCAAKPQAALPKFSVIIADIVHSFKLEGGVYTDQKKVGAAVLGNAQAYVFQVLLYRTLPAGKQDYIAVAKITNDFRFLVQPKLYCSFYDDTRNYWSLVFNRSASCMQFARQVGAAQFRALHGKSVVAQLIDAGEEGAAVGDSTHLTISQQNFDVDSISPYNPIEATIKVSVNPSQAKWSEGLVSATSGSKWAIFIPTGTPLPWASKAETPLVLEVVVEKTLPTTSSTAPVDLEKVPGEETVQAKGAFLTESLASTASSSKASLISRVARMGKPTLPLKGAVLSNPTDSEDTEEETSSIASSSTLKPPVKPKFSKGRSGTARHASSESDQGYANPKSSAPVTNSIWRPVVSSDNKLVQYVAGDGQMMAMPTTAQQYQLIASTPVTSPSEPVSMLVSEARIQNTEMRMNMSRIMDKIDNLATKVDGISSGSGSRAAAPLPTGGMDPGNLLSSIEQLVKDNQTLTAEVAEKKQKLNELNERVFALVDANAKILEQNKALLDEKQKSSTDTVDAQIAVVQKAQIEFLEKEKTALVEETAVLKSRLKLLEELNSQLKTRKESELSAKDSELSAKVSELSAKDCELGATVSELTLKNSELGIKDSELKDLHALLTAKEVELKAALAKVENLQNSGQQDVSKVEDAETLAERYEADIAELQELVTSLSMNIVELEVANGALQKSEEELKTALETRAKTYDETIVQLKSQLSEASSNRYDYDSAVRNLKVLVNNIYKKILQYLEGNNTVSSSVVKKIVAVVLKSEVTQYLEELLLKQNRPALESIGASARTESPPVNETPASTSETGESNNILAPQSAAVALLKTGPTDSARPQTEFWESEPPPVPDFEEEDTEDDWLKMKN